MKNPLKNTEPIKTKTEFKKEMAKVKRYNRWIEKKIKQKYTTADIRQFLLTELTEEEVNNLLDWRGRF